MASEKGPVVKLDANGNVVACAKELPSADCGYKVGSEICGKCGAMAMQIKMGFREENLEPSPMLPQPKKKKKKKMQMEMGEKAAVRAYGDVYDDEEEMEDEDEMEMEDEMDDVMVSDEEEMEEEDEEMEEEDEEMEDEGEMEDEIPVTPRRPMSMQRRRPMPQAPMAEDEEEMEEEMEDGMDEEEMMPTRRSMENRRLNTMGYKSDEFGIDPFLCAIERKVYPGNSQVCENCVGGCVKEGDMPALLEIEGRAEDMFSGKVLDSGYSDKADIFVVDVERKDGKPIEVYFDGTSGEVMGWHLLNEEVLQVKSGFQPSNMISFADAATIATKSIQGDVMAVEADIFEGFDAYAVEIEGIDGKSYDVYVSLDGDVLGYDQYTQEEALSIEAEAAEIALKRAYPDDKKKMMAQSGEAMEDGEFPIANDTDLRNAIMAWPRSKNPEVAKLHIMKRAMALGLENSIPDGWITDEEKRRAQTGEKSEEENFLSTLLEFEMLAAEEGVEDVAAKAEERIKRAFSEERRMELAKQGSALPDGSYPIVTAEDLSNAIQAYGRAKDKVAAKKHIMKRARALGKEDMIPENWKNSESE